MTDLTILFERRMWKTLGLWTRKVVEFYRQCLIGHPSRNLKDSGFESNVCYGSLDQKVSILALG